MWIRPLLVLVGISASCTALAACGAGSSGGSPTLVAGTYSAESGATLPAQLGDCGINPSGNINTSSIAQLAGRFGIRAQSNPVDALRAALTHGSMPFFGGSGGSGLVGEGYPTGGWTEVSAKEGSVMFRAPLHSGTAKITFSRVGSRWLVNHYEKDC